MTEIVETTSSAKQTEAFGARLAKAVFGDGDAPFALRPPLVFLLEGDLGAGKTTLVRGFVRALPGGTDIVVQSPTFALARSYATTPPVHHLDLYRLQDTGDAHSLEELGLLELLRDGISFVEWPVPATPWSVRVGAITFRILSPRRRELRVTLPDP